MISKLNFFVNVFWTVAGTMERLNEFLIKRATMDAVEDNELSYSDVFYNKELCAGFATYLESMKLVDALLLAFELGNVGNWCGHLELNFTDYRDLPFSQRNFAYPKSHYYLPEVHCSQPISCAGVCQ